MAKILIVEDDPAISATVQSFLEDENHTVEAVLTGGEGLDLLLHYSFDAAILDWQLPDTQGPDIARSLSSAGKLIPILMLTSRSTVADRIEGLDSGVFDYVVKPCSREEISARLRALLRRTPAPDQSTSIVTLGNLRMDLVAHRLEAASVAVMLSPGEFDILKLLMKNPGSSFSAAAIFTRLWPDKENLSKHLVRTHIFNIRKKLAAAGADVEVLTNDLVEYHVKVADETP